MMRRTSVCVQGLNDASDDDAVYLCAADLEKLEDVSAYDVLKPTVVTESDVIVRKCVIGE